MFEPLINVICQLNFNAVFLLPDHFGGFWYAFFLFCSTLCNLRAFSSVSSYSYTFFLQALNAKMALNKIGSMTRLTTSKYTFPSDGYVRAYTDGSGGVSIIVGISDSGGNTFASISASVYASSSVVFVRKGMMGHILSQTNATNAKAWFIPFTE